MVSLCVLDIYVYGGGVGHISDTALVRCNLMSYAVFLNERHPHTNVSEFEVELVLLVSAAVRVSCDDRVRLNDLLYFAINEIVVRIYVLLDKTP